MNSLLQSFMKIIQPLGDNLFAVLAAAAAGAPVLLPRWGLAVQGCGSGPPAAAAAKIENEGSRRPNARAAGHLGIRTSDIPEFGRPDVRASGRPSVGTPERPYVRVSARCGEKSIQHRRYSEGGVTCVFAIPYM